MKGILFNLSIAALTGALITLVGLMLTEVYAQYPNTVCPPIGMPGCAANEDCNNCITNNQPPAPECSLLPTPPGTTWQAYRYTRVPYYTCTTGTKTCTPIQVHCAELRLYGQPKNPKTGECGGGTCNESTPIFTDITGCLPPP